MFWDVFGRDVFVNLPQNNCSYLRFRSTLVFRALDCLDSSSIASSARRFYSSNIYISLSTIVYRWFLNSESSFWDSINTAPHLRHSSSLLKDIRITSAFALVLSLISKYRCPFSRVPFLTTVLRKSVMNLALIENLSCLY